MTIVLERWRRAFYYGGNRNNTKTRDDISKLSTVERTDPKLTLGVD